MEKVIRDGKVAVLYSRDYGAGWYTWNGYKELIFHPELVKMVEEGRVNEITSELCERLLGLEEDSVCVLGADDLVIAWLSEGTIFTIEEYDGAESIKTIDDLILTA